MSHASICSQALLLLGEHPISSLDDETDAARICKAIYFQHRAHCLTVHPWIFNTRRQIMSREFSPPQSQWRYSFMMPGDMIGMGPHYLLSSTTATRPLRAGFDYSVEGNQRVLSDLDELHAVYAVDADDQTWPPVFTEYVVAALAAKLAYPITDQQNTAQYWSVQAHGSPHEQGRGGLFAVAASVEGWTAGQQQINSDDLLAWRFS